MSTIIPTRMRGLKNVITMNALFLTLAKYSLLMINLRLRIGGNGFNENVID